MTNIKIEIKSIFGKVLFTYECEGNTIAKTVTEAIKSDADLSSANLSSANLSSANLRSANLSYADLSYADLRSANLSDADLRSANLSSANLRYANLSDADLRYADLSDANLRDADLSSVRNDFWDVLIRAPKEIQGLKAAIISGKINGSVYAGECACLVGTIANIRQCSYKELSLIKPNSSRPIERFFLGINSGDTPENNQVSAIVNTWLDEFISLTTQLA